MKNIITYEIKNKKYFKDGKEVSKNDILKELKKYQIDKLNLTGKCNVTIGRIISPNCSVKNKIANKESIEFKGEQQSLKHFTYSRNEFSVDIINSKICLYKLNKKYGYYNFIMYLDSLEISEIQKSINQYLSNNK